MLGSIFLFLPFPKKNKAAFKGNTFSILSIAQRLNKRNMKRRRSGSVGSRSYEKVLNICCCATGKNGSFWNLLLRFLLLLLCFHSSIACDQNYKACHDWRGIQLLKRWFKVQKQFDFFYSLPPSLSGDLLTRENKWSRTGHGSRMSKPRLLNLFCIIQLQLGASLHVIKQRDSRQSQMREIRQEHSH